MGSIIEVVIRADAAAAQREIEGVTQKVDRFRTSATSVSSELRTTRQSFVVLTQAVARASDVAELFGVDMGGVDRILITATSTLATVTQAVRVFAGTVTAAAAAVGAILGPLALFTAAAAAQVVVIWKAIEALQRWLGLMTITEQVRKAIDQVKGWIGATEDITAAIEDEVKMIIYEREQAELAARIRTASFERSVAATKAAREASERMAKQLAAEAAAAAKAAAALRERLLELELSAEIEAIIGARRMDDERIRKEQEAAGRKQSEAEAELNRELEEEIQHIIDLRAWYEKLAAVRRDAFLGGATNEDVARRQAEAILALGPSEEAIALLEALSAQYDEMGTAGEAAGKVIRAALIEVLILLGKLPAGVQAGTDALTEWGKTLQNLTEMGEEFLSSFLQGSLDLRDVWRDLVKFMADQWSEAISRMLKGVDSFDKIMGDLFGGIQNAALAAIGLIANFAVGKKKAAEQVRKQALEEARRVAEMLADMVRSTVAPALQQAFGFDLFFGLEHSWEVFTNRLRRQLFEQVQAGLIEAFIRSSAVQAAIGPLLSAVEAQIALTTATGIFDPAAFAGAIGPAINLFNATLGTLEPLFASVFSMLTGAGMGLGVLAGANPFAAMGIPASAVPAIVAPAAFGIGVPRSEFEIPGLQGGGIVQRGGLAFVHAGEEVVPAGGGGIVINFTHHGALMGNEIEARNFARQIMEQVRKAAGRR